MSGLMKTLRRYASGAVLGQRANGQVRFALRPTTVSTLGELRQFVLDAAVETLPADTPMRFDRTGITLGKES